MTTPTFQVSPATRPRGLDGISARRGYRLHSPTIVEVAMIEDVLHRIPRTNLEVGVPHQPGTGWRELWWAIDGRGAPSSCCRPRHPHRWSGAVCLNSRQDRDHSSGTSGPRRPVGRCVSHGRSARRTASWPRDSEPSRAACARCQPRSATYVAPSYRRQQGRSRALRARWLRAVLGLSLPRSHHPIADRSALHSAASQPEDGGHVGAVGCDSGSATVQQASRGSVLSRGGCGQL